MNVPSNFNPIIRHGIENHGWHDNIEIPLREYFDNNPMHTNVEKHIENVFLYGNTTGIYNGSIWFVELVDERPVGWSDDDQNSVDAF